MPKAVENLGTHDPKNSASGSASDHAATVAENLAASRKADVGATLASFLSPATGPDELGWLAHYRVLGVIGQGGMGVVLAAEDSHLQRRVALKVILPEYAGSMPARERFLREARACAALKSDHVVTIYQVGQDRDVPFLAMELLKGETLADRLSREGRLSVTETLRIAGDVAEGLASAHENGLIHRDIKPANIWLEAPSGRVKLLDFGLARPTGVRSELTKTGIVGTPEYMSPEQARGGEVDARTDLFSLGVVLYAMCTGSQPFAGDSLMAMLTSLAVDTPRSVRELNPDVPPDLANLIVRLLEKDPARRPDSALEVQRTLAAITPPAPASGSYATQYPPVASPPTHATATEPASTAPTVIAPTVVPATYSPAVPTHESPGRLTATVPTSPPRWLIGVVSLALTICAGIAIYVTRPGFGPHLEDLEDAATKPVTLLEPPVRLGILHSRTGTMSISERPVIDAITLAVDEINEQGGVLGRRVESVLADGQSEEAVFAREAERLITQEQVRAIFGCWTSASRKAVLPVVEKHDHLLFYPVQYEGLEQSRHIVYSGAVPNQQILPALHWLIGFENKRRWFLVGSDYVFPVMANAVIRDEAKTHGAEILGEEYLLLGTTDVATVVRQIEKVQPDLIVSTINGDTNIAFFRALRNAGITSAKIPTVSFSISSEELTALGPRATEGDYVAASYFQTIDSSRNREFLERFAKRYGWERTVSDAMQTAYYSAHLWAQAVRAARSDEPAKVRAAIRGRTYDAPQGNVRIEPETLHTTQISRVGRIDGTGQVLEVYASPTAVAPIPYPPSRSREQWISLLESLRERWGGRWSNSGTR